MKKLTNTTPTQPTVKYVTDRNGNAWICDVDADSSGDLRGQGCVSVEDWVYDRNFGG